MEPDQMTTKPHADESGPQDIAGELAFRRARALVAWLPRDEALRILLGHNPAAGEDTGSAEALYRASATALERLPHRAIGSPELTESPIDLSAIAQRTDVQGAFAPMVWRPAVVNLRAVLSFQKLVVTEGLDERVPAKLSDSELIELCLPSKHAPLPSGAFTDNDGKGLTISSINPNLRVAGIQLGTADVSPGPAQATQRMTAVTVLVSMGASYVQIAGYRGRYFVRDGNHRVVGLIKRGIFEVPAIVIEARSFEELLGSAAPGAFTYEVLYGDAPPFLTDFWDDSVAREVKQPAVRKVVRVRGEEFVVPR